MSRWRPLARLALFATLYLGLLWVGRQFTDGQVQASPVWLPSGLVLFALLVTPTRQWPAVALTAIALAFITHHSGHSWALTLLVSTCGALEGLAGAFLLRRFVGPRLDLHRVRDVLGLVALSAVLSCLLTASVAVVLTVLFGESPWALYWSTWWVFWVGDGMGVLVLTPLLIAWTQGLADWQRLRSWELAGFLLVLGLATHVVFGGELLQPWALHSLVYLSIPLILWSALRFEAVGVTSATALLSLVALWHTAHGHGPFARSTVEHQAHLSLTVLQVFLGALNISGLLLAAALGERRRAQLEVSSLNQELRQSLETLARTQSELVARERMAALGELSATVAHEVRNPLGAIFNCVSALRHLSGSQPHPDQEGLLGIISEEVQRLDQLVNGLLDFARPAQPSPRPEPLAAVVEEALCTALRSQAASSRVTVRREVDPDLPLALVDARLLHVALSNLFTNALQAMPEGGTLHVRIAREERAAQRLLLSIADTGRGMPPEVQRRIFEPFFTTRANGVGLGLPIVQRIVESHLGQMDVRSSEGLGTTFTVRLPSAES